MMGKNKSDEIKNYKAIYYEDLYYITEHWYDKKGKYDEEFDDDYYKEDGTYVYWWKKRYQIYQSKSLVKIFKLYHNDEFVDFVMINSSYVDCIEDLKHGDEISVRGYYDKIEDLRVRKRNQGIGSYSSKRKFLIDKKIYDWTWDNDYSDVQDETVNYLIRPTKKAIKLTKTDE